MTQPLAQKDVENPFFIRNKRAMVSLGPLSKSHYCPYRCAFCYVQGGFESYANLRINEIVNYLIKKKDEFDIIYISGDTDSFAPPRKKKGLELLNTLSEEFDCDILFTTRTTFNSDELNTLSDIRQCLETKNKKLFGCISITRWQSASYIEPSPIPSPVARMETLKNLKRIGLISVLTLRPFLPIIPIPEYYKIISACQSFTDIVLGEVWYADRTGIIERRVFKGNTPTRISFTEQNMDFDDNKIIWKVWEAKETKEKVSSFCVSKGLPFFMRSGPAIDYIRKKGI